MDITIAEILLEKIVADVRVASTLIDRLHKRGYIENFELVDNKLKCLRTNDYFSASDLRVDDVYQIDEEVIGLSGYFVYALRLPNTNIKGIFVAIRNMKKK